HEIETSSHDGPGVDILEDSVDFLDRLETDARLNVCSYTPTHRIILLGCRVSLCLAKLRTLQGLAYANMGGEFGLQEADVSQSHITQASLQLATLLEHMALLGMTLGLVPVSNF